MLVVAIVAAALALLLAILWWRARTGLAALTHRSGSIEAELDDTRRDLQRLGDERRNLDDRISAAEGERDRLRDELASVEERAGTLDADSTRLRAELEAAEERITDLVAATDRLEEQLGEADDDRRRLEAELTAARDEHERAADDAERRSAELATANEHLQATAGERDRLRAEVTEVTHEVERLGLALAESEDRSRRPSEPSLPDVLVGHDTGAGFDAATGWQLELVRSERTWRYSVAANPLDDPDPFPSSNDPLRLAIEIEALALREDVGAFIGIDWRAEGRIDPTADPARAHLTLRIAQELLAAAAREPDPSTLVVEADEERGGVSLRIVPTDPDAIDFKIPPPPIASEWIGIDTEGGLVVTVRTDGPSA